MTHSAHPPGLHILLDLHGARDLDDAARLESILRAAARAAGARVLGARFHRFGDTGGVTGVVLLADSHITVHTWPELGFAAVDVFLCGAAQPDLACDHVERALSPARATRTRIARGS